MNDAVAEELYEMKKAGLIMTEDLPPMEIYDDLEATIPATHLHPVNLSGLMETELDPPSFAIEQLIPTGEVTLLGGHGGAGKSIFALTLAAHFAASHAWAGLTVKGGKALYISLEDPAEVMRFRLKKIIEGYDLDGADVVDNLAILDGSEGDGSLMTEVSKFGTKSLKETSVFEELKTACKGYGLIIIDNASDAYGGDENSRRQVRSFIRTLRDIARREGAGIVLLAHIDKNAARYGANGNAYSGSTAWHNSVRSRLVLLENKGAIELRQEKLNLGKKMQEPPCLHWAEGVLMTGGEVNILDVADMEEADKHDVLMAIRAAIKDGADIPTARTGPKTTQGVLERHPDLPSSLRGKKGRDRFYSALSALQRSGVLAIEEYKTASRHTQERFAIKGAK